MSEQLGATATVGSTSQSQQQQAQQQKMQQQLQQKYQSAINRQPNQPTSPSTSTQTTRPYQGVIGDYFISLLHPTQEQVQGTMHYPTAPQPLPSSGGIYTMNQGRTLEERYLNVEALYGNFWLGFGAAFNPFATTPSVSSAVTSGVYNYVTTGKFESPSNVMRTTTSTEQISGLAPTGAYVTPQRQDVLLTLPSGEKTYVSGLTPTGQVGLMPSRADWTLTKTTTEPISQWEIMGQHPEYLAGNLFGEAVSFIVAGWLIGKGVEALKGKQTLQLVGAEQNLALTGEGKLAEMTGYEVQVQRVLGKVEVSPTVDLMGKAEAVQKGVGYYGGQELNFDVTASDKAIQGMQESLWQRTKNVLTRQTGLTDFLKGETRTYYDVNVIEPKSDVIPLKSLYTSPYEESGIVDIEKGQPIMLPSTVAKNEWELVQTTVKYPSPLKTILGKGAYEVTEKRVMTDFTDLPATAVREAGLNIDTLVKNGGQRYRGVMDNISDSLSARGLVEEGAGFQPVKTEFPKTPFKPFDFTDKVVEDTGKNVDTFLTGGETASQVTKQGTKTLSQQSRASAIAVMDSNANLAGASSVFAKSIAKNPYASPVLSKRSRYDTVLEVLQYPPSSKGATPLTKLSVSPAQGTKALGKVNIGAMSKAGLGQYNVGVESMVSDVKSVQSEQYKLSHDIVQSSKQTSSGIKASIKGEQTVGSILGMGLGSEFNASLKTPSKAIASPLTLAPFVPLSFGSPSGFEYHPPRVSGARRKWKTDYFIPNPFFSEFGARNLYITQSSKKVKRRKKK